MHNPTRRASTLDVCAVASLQLAEAPKEPNGEASDWRTDPSVAMMERLRDGDMDAFQILFKKHGAAITAFAYRFLGSRERAEEAAQSVFLQLFRARERYQPQARFTTYLYRIATNLCLNELRRVESSIKVESLDVTDGSDPNREGVSLMDRLVDTRSPGPVERLACREAAAEITKALDRLPSNQRQALWLSRIDGCSYREVADDLDSSIGAVKSLIFRATATLRRDLAEIR